MITETEFNQRADALLLALEQALDESPVDVDYETVGGVLTLHFANGSAVVVNRQLPLRQIWVAAKSGGFHFSYDEHSPHWYDTQSREPLLTTLGRCCSEQAGATITFAMD